MYGSHESPLFEIGIYRCSYETFSADYKRDWEKRHGALIREWQAVGGNPPESTLNWNKQNFWETYGGPWYYNQAIAWLRIVVSYRSIYGQLWATKAKRLSRVMKRQQIILSPFKQFEVVCLSSHSSDQILAELRKELNEFQRTYRKGKCFLDLECFEMASKFIDWREVVNYNYS